MDSCKEIVQDVKRGKGIKFDRIRRITGVRHVLD